MSFYVLGVDNFDTDIPKMSLLCVGDCCMSALTVHGSAGNNCKCAAVATHCAVILAKSNGVCAVEYRSCAGHIVFYFDGGTTRNYRADRNLIRWQEGCSAGKSLYHLVPKFDTTKSDLFTVR